MPSTFAVTGLPGAPPGRAASGSTPERHDGAACTGELGPARRGSRSGPNSRTPRNARSSPHDHGHSTRKRRSSQVTAHIAKTFAYRPSGFTRLGWACDPLADERDDRVAVGRPGRQGPRRRGLDIADLAHAGCGQRRHELVHLRYLRLRLGHVHGGGGRRFSAASALFQPTGTRCTRPLPRPPGGSRRCRQAGTPVVIPGAPRPAGTAGFGQGFLPTSEKRRHHDNHRERRITGIRRRRGPGLAANLVAVVVGGVAVAGPAHAGAPPSLS
jgi:hypothetical protein